jgi:hypothetical protein
MGENTPYRPTVASQSSMRSVLFSPPVISLDGENKILFSSVCVGNGFRVLLKKNGHFFASPSVSDVKQSRVQLEKK